jgi:hypothetical protein
MVCLGLSSRGDIGMAQFSCGESVEDASSHRARPEMERGEKVLDGRSVRGFMLIASPHTSH